MANAVLSSARELMPSFMNTLCRWYSAVRALMNRRPPMSLQHHRGHVKRVGQERPQVPHRGQLQGMAQSRVITAALRDKGTVRVVQEEHPV